MGHFRVEAALYYNGKVAYQHKGQNHAQHRADRGDRLARRAGLRSFGIFGGAHIYLPLASSCDVTEVFLKLGDSPRISTLTQLTYLKSK